MISILQRNKIDSWVQSTKVLSQSRKVGMKSRHCKYYLTFSWIIFVAIVYMHYLWTYFVTMIWLSIDSGLDIWTREKKNIFWARKTKKKYLSFKIIFRSYYGEAKFGPFPVLRFYNYATFEGGFFMFSRAKISLFVFSIYFLHCSVCTKKLISMKMRKISFSDSKYTFCGQNRLKNGSI